MEEYKYIKYKKKYINLKNDKDQEGGIITLHHGYHIFFYSKYRLDLVDKKRTIGISKKVENEIGNVQADINNNKALSWYDLMNNMDPLMIYTRLDKLYLDDSNISLCEKELNTLKDKYGSLLMYKHMIDNEKNETTNICKKTYVDEINDILLKIKENKILNDTSNNEIHNTLTQIFKNKKHIDIINNNIIIRKLIIGEINKNDIIKKKKYL